MAVKPWAGEVCTASFRLFRAGRLDNPVDLL
jgi:hypothetical protein